MYQEITDEVLLANYFDGDKAAFRVLFDRHKDALFRYFTRQCSNAAIAEELFQDVWMSLCKSRARFRGDSKFTTYFYQIAHNRLIDYYRQRHRNIEAQYDSDDEQVLANIAGNSNSQPENLLDSQGQVARLLKILQGLPAPQREVILLREESGMSLQEIAQATGVGRETVKSRLRYALDRIREGMEEK